MCDKLDEALMVQAVDWVFESTWKLMDAYPDLGASIGIEMLINDIVHLDNVARGVVGYKPDLNFDFAIGI